MIVDHEPRLLVGRYRVGEPLGAGGMGMVVAGHDLRLDRAVAIKLLRPELARDPGLRRRFEREARSAARVVHPNAVAVYDTGEDADHDAFIVMELLSGRTLAHEVADGGPLDEARLRDVADGVLAALGAAHAVGIVHRDVKPGNILLAEDGAVKVGDFGIATSLDPDETTTAVPLGTPAYSAPERLRGLPATGRSDLYSLGVVLYEAATGQRPFTGEGPTSVAEAIVAGTHAPVGDLRPALRPELAAAIERALANDPEDRYADAAAMRSALDPVAPATAVPTVPLAPPTPTATATLPAPVASPVPSPPPARAPRRWWIAAAVAVAAVVAVTILLLVTGGGEPASTPPASSAPTPTTLAEPSAPVSTAPVPAPLARALDRLDEATQP